MGDVQYCILLAGSIFAISFSWTLRCGYVMTTAIGQEQLGQTDQLDRPGYCSWERSVDSPSIKIFLKNG
jgi:hypothetical protein